MVYLAFFLLRDGSKLVDLLIKALPLGDERERLLFAKFAEVTRATVKGNLLIAIIQGALGGLIFWLLGIQWCAALGGGDGDCIPAAGRWGGVGLGACRSLPGGRWGDDCRQ